MSGPYIVPGYWAEGYVDESQWQIILLGAAGHWRRHAPPQPQQVKPKPKPEPRRVPEMTAKAKPIPQARSTLAASVDRGPRAAPSVPSVRSSLVRK